MYGVYEDISAAIAFRAFAPPNLTALMTRANNLTGKGIAVDVLSDLLHSDHDLGLNIQLSLILGWILLVASSSFIPSLGFKVLDLKAAWKGLMDARQSRLDFLDVFRVVAIVWVMANHLGSEGRVDILERKPTAEAFKSAVHNHPVLGALLGNSALGVEIFLVLSGLLAARSWHRQADQPFLRHSYVFLVKRILRLLPVVAVFISLAAGPVLANLLPRFHSSMISQCGWKGIMSHLTLTSNWQSTPTCLGYLWYVGLDMQLYLIAPIMLHMFYKYTKQTALLTAAMISASAAYRAYYCAAYNVCNKSDVDIPFISFPGQDPETLKQIYAGQWEMYGRPFTKCGPFLIGLALGFATNNLKLELAPSAARRIFMFGLSLGVVVIYAILPEYWYPDMQTNTYNLLYTALFRIVFAVAVSVAIFSLFYNKEQTRISRFWTVLAKLTFNVYLWHMPMVYIFNHVAFFQTTSSAYALVALLPFLTLFSFGMALVFYCFVEDPVSRLSSMLLKNL